MDIDQKQANRPSSGRYLDWHGQVGSKGLCPCCINLRLYDKVMLTLSNKPIMGFSGLKSDVFCKERSAPFRFLRNTEREYRSFILPDGKESICKISTILFHLFFLSVNLIDTCVLFWSPLDFTI